LSELIQQRPERLFLLEKLPSRRRSSTREIYEEKPEIHKEAFVREEVRVKKVVEQDTVEAQETLLVEKSWTLTIPRSWIPLIGYRMTVFKQHF